MQGTSKVQERAIVAAQFETERHYWVERLTGVWEKAGFPFDLLHKPGERSSGELSFQLTGETFGRVEKLAGGSEPRLLMVLASAVSGLHFRWTSQTDFILGMPTLKQEKEGEFINTLLLLKNKIEEGMSFKDLLLQMRQTITEANKFQNFPVEVLPQLLNLEASEDEGFPFFDVALLLENIQDIHYINHVLPPVVFSFLKKEEQITGTIHYDERLYRTSTIENLARLFCRFIAGVSADVNLPLSSVSLLDKEEKHRLLVEWNDTATDFPRDKSIAQLFREQVEAGPHRTALVSHNMKGEKVTFTYLRLYQIALHIGRVLSQKGIGPDRIVALMLQPSLELYCAIMGIQVSGGAYLPLEPNMPEERKKYMVADSCASLLLTAQNIGDKQESALNLYFEKEAGKEILYIEDLIEAERSGGKGGNGAGIQEGRRLAETGQWSSENLAYIIYTSGSTGKPKGVMISNRNVACLVKEGNFIELIPGDRLIQLSNVAFDASVYDIFAMLLNGSVLVGMPPGKGMTVENVAEVILSEQVTVFLATTAFFNLLADEAHQDPGSPYNVFRQLRKICMGGERASVPHSAKALEVAGKGKIANIYGPTETTVGATRYLVDQVQIDAGTLPIGFPLTNTTLYILGKDLSLMPVGMTGEIYLGGDGNARGYLNRPELTEEAFIPNPFVPGQRLYRTGDLGRRLPDGAVEFAGRIDHQVKIRGFRIEMEEIEKRLLEIDVIKEAVVLDLGEDGEKYLCAYLVYHSISNATSKTTSNNISTVTSKAISIGASNTLSKIPSETAPISTAEIKETLGRLLPDFMIPAHFVGVDKIPLTANGKVDRRALPLPDIGGDTEYVAPANPFEQKLTAIWSKVLGLPPGKISVTANFFQLGGHSLKATSMVSAIHKTFQFKLSLAEIFKAPTIRDLAKITAAAATDRKKESYIDIEPAEKREFYPLSSAQKRLYIVQQMNPAGTGYNMPQVVPLPMDVDREFLEGVFHNLILRHESLRTRFLVLDDEPKQLILQPQEIHFSIDFHDLTHSPRGDLDGGLFQGTIEGIINNFVRPFDLSSAPLLRVGLIKLGETDHLFLMDKHHIITDGISQEIFIADLMALLRGESLPPLRLQYTDYALWQHREKESPAARTQENYWVERFSDEVPLLNLPTDYPRPRVQSFEGSMLSFVLSPEETEGLKQLAFHADATLFMVILGLYTILLSKLSGAEDIVVGTPIAGRRHEDLQNMMGMFINTLALRGFPAGDKSVAAFLRETRENTLEAFENQEYQFEDLVEKVTVSRDLSRNPLFDVLFSWPNVRDVKNSETAKADSGTQPPAPTAERDTGGQMAGDGEYSKGYENRTSKFDLTLTAMERGGGIGMQFQYSVRLLKEATVKRFITYFKNLVTSVIKSPERLLSQTTILTEEEKKRLIFDFNDTETQYPSDLTIHQLFEAQVKRTPDNIAAVFKSPSGEASNLHSANSDVPNGSASPEPATSSKAVQYGGPGGATPWRPLRKRPRRAAGGMTYNELNACANRLARNLRRRGLRAGDVAAIVAEPSIYLVVGVLAILKAGAAYLPIEQEYPADRILYMLADSGARLLLCLDEWETASELEFDGEILRLDTDAIYNGADFDLPAASNPESALYAIYTSGSTGLPKGVLLRHRNMVNYASWFASAAGIEKNHRSVLTSSFAFDLGYTTFYPCITRGGEFHVISRETYLFPNRLFDYIVENKITYLKMTPSLFTTLVEDPAFTAERFQSLKVVVLGGEAIIVKDVARAYEVCPNIRIMNHYGPSETTVGSVAMFIQRDKLSHYMERPTIGYPIHNTQVYILDKYGQLTPPGVSGELCISGDGVAKGYLNRPDLTAEKFMISSVVPPAAKTLFEKRVLDSQKLLIARPLATCDASEGRSHSSFSISVGDFSTIYKTGDLARRLDDGRIEFLGRIDHQVKIRGYRIELGEIENRLLEHEAITETVVLVREDSEGNKTICAYIVYGQEVSQDARPGIGELREFMGRDLPDYMIPSFFIPLEKIPVTANMKVDRRALPEPEASDSGADYAAPRNRREKELVEIWAGVLAVEKDTLSIDANFFHLGGHSLKATVLIARIHKTLDVKLPLVELFKTPTIRGISEYMEKAAPDLYAAIEPAEKKEYYTLSSAQKRQYVLQQLEEGTAYNMPRLIDLPGIVEPERLETTFRAMIARHESLRTSFRMVGEVPVQVIHPAAEIPFSVEAHTIPEDVSPAEGVAAIFRDFKRPFDLSSAPLMRAGVIDVPGSFALLMLDTHHIISDGISHQVFRREFIDLYDGLQLEPLRLQYKDYAQWQEQEKEGSAMLQQEAFWLAQFSDEVPVINLPIDFERPALQSFEGSSMGVTLPGHVSNRLKAFAKEEGATLFMLLLSIADIFLAKVSNQEDIVVGTPTAGRGHADLENVLGMFVNTLVLRNFPRSSDSFRIFFRELKERTLEAFENQDYQFEDLVDKVVVNRDTGRNPLFDVMFALDTMDSALHDSASASPGIGDDGDKQSADTSVDPAPVSSSARPGGIPQDAKFDLSISGGDTGNGLVINIQYCTTLFMESSAARFMEAFKRIAAAIALNPDMALGQIEIITDEEKELILDTFNNTRMDYPLEGTVYRLFEEQALRVPGNIALTGRPGSKPVSPGEMIEPEISLNYEALNQRANRLACLLREKGIGSDDIVGLMVERSIQMVVGIMAIWKAGGAYMPISPSTPQERIGYMMTDSSSKVLLTHCYLIANAPTGSWDNIDLEEATYSKYQETNPGINGEAAHLAYVIYTSGTTGKPKGVLVQHHSVVNRLNWLKHLYNTCEADVMMQKTTFTFDVSVCELFRLLVVGGHLYLLPDGGEKDPEIMVRAVEEHGITMMDFVPSMLNLFLDYVHSRETVPRLATLRQVIVGVEVLPIKLVKKFREILALPFGVSLHNAYGPTEATVDVTYYDCTAALKEPRSIPIGKPIGNVQIHILDKHGNMQPVGIMGEILIGGFCLARGYLNNPELTAEKFAPIALPVTYHQSSPPAAPNQSSPLTTFYHTGDYGRWRTDGNIEFMGRIDQQVKVRGFRVEPGEVESRLLNHDAIKEVVVLARKDNNNENYLCAYLVSSAEVDSTELKKYLGQYLPEYMVPAFFMFLDKIPLTVQGKINRKALPIPEITSGDGYVAPAGEVEKKLAAIWSEVLAIEEKVIGVETSFFQLGGHSLKATILTAKVHKVMDVKVPLAEIFKNPTIRGMAHYIRNAAVDKYVGIEPAEVMEFYPLSSAQQRLYVLNQMNPNSNAYNVPQNLPVDPEIEPEGVKKAFLKLLHRHESLRTSFHMIDEEPKQKVHALEDLDFDIQFYEKMGDAKRSPAELAQIMGAFVRPFDLSKAPLLRVGMIDLGEEGYILMIDIHHIITDGTSNGLLRSSFHDLYRDEEMPPMRLQYKDYAVWQNNRSEGSDFSKQENYWLSQFDAGLPVVDLSHAYIPGAASLPASQLEAANHAHFTTERRVTHFLRELAEKEDATMFMTILAIFNVLLAKIGDTQRIIVGTPVAGRSHADLHLVIGMFVNTLALINEPLPDLSFREFLRQVRDNSLTAFDNQDYPFDRLVEKVYGKRSIGRNPVFDVMFSFHTLEISTEPHPHPEDLEKQQQFQATMAEAQAEQAEEAPDQSATRTTTGSGRTAKFDLTLVGTEAPDHVVFNLEYRAGLFEPETIERFTNHLKEILQTVMENPDIKIKDIEISHRLERAEAIEEDIDFDF